MLSAWVAVAWLAAAADPVALTGTVLVHGTSLHARTLLHHGTEKSELVGELTVELRRLQSATVEVVGQPRDDGTFEAKEYRIIDVGGGVRPLVGLLAGASGSLQLVDGRGEPIALNVSATLAARLVDKVGAKIWVHGTTLVSGELRVLRYGILRDPPARRAPLEP